MRNSMAILSLFLLCFSGVAQNANYELPTRQTPTFTKAQLPAAKLVTDLTPLLWSNIGLPGNEAYYLEQRRVNEEGPQVPGYLYPQQMYKQTIEYVSVSIGVMSNGRGLSATGNSDMLTAEQKNLLAAADLGSTIRITIRFQYKDQGMDNFGLRNEVIQGVANVTVVPETEAAYPGGHKQLSAYYAGNVIGKLADKKASEKVQMAIVKFTVTEEGKVVNAQLSQTTNDANIDRLILDATANMPRWTPAVNAKGEKVKQEISIPFGAGGC